MGDKILIVTSNYYKNVSDNLKTGASNFLKENRYSFDLIDAPGCFEIPFLIKKNINNYLGFLALGCIIRGETYHFELISNECARKIMNLSVDFNKPIGLFKLIEYLNTNQRKRLNLSQNLVNNLSKKFNKTSLNLEKLINKKIR